MGVSRPAAGNTIGGIFHTVTAGAFAHANPIGWPRVRGACFHLVVCSWAKLMGAQTDSPQFTHRPSKLMGAQPDSSRKTHIHTHIHFLALPRRAGEQAICTARTTQGHSGGHSGLKDNRRVRPAITRASCGGRPLLSKQHLTTSTRLARTPGWYAWLSAPMA